MQEVNPFFSKTPRGQFGFLGLSIVVFALYVILSTVLHAKSDYFKNDNSIPLEVYINSKSSGLNTRNTVIFDGSKLIYGTTGKVLYRPNSLSDAIIYTCLSGATRSGVIDYLVMLFIGLYICIVSLTIGKDEFFSQKTYQKFIGLMALSLILFVLRMGLLDWVASRFYEETKHALELNSEAGGSAILMLHFMQFSMFFFTIIFTRGAKVQKEQELTI